MPGRGWCCPAGWRPGEAGYRVHLYSGYNRFCYRTGDCQWTRDGFGLGVKTSLPGFPRYRMSEAGDPGDCDLIIDPVLPADEAVFQCQAGLSQVIIRLSNRDILLTEEIKFNDPIL